jgi:chromosomal replication initiation ATPase DnaA
MAKAKSKATTSPEKAIFIHGPSGCGKSKNAEALCAHYGKSHAVDYDHDTKPIPADALVFLQEPNPNFPHAIAFHDAMRAAGLAE